MAVLVECISVVVPVSVLKRSYPGGERGYSADAPNATYCCDGGVTRVGFMASPDVQMFARRLSNLGIEYLVDERARDLVVVDQHDGILAPCDWLEFGTAELFDAGTISMVALRGEQMKRVAFPVGWEWGRSMSNPAQAKIIRKAERAEHAVVRREGKMDVVRGPDGTETYLGRPFAIVPGLPEPPSNSPNTHENLPGA